MAQRGSAALRSAPLARRFSRLRQPRADVAMTSHRPIIVVELRPNPGVDLTRSLRALLNIALRRYGLRCIAIKEDG
jgi:hypothetical protein